MKKLEVTQNMGLTWYKDSIDAWWSRFCLFPFDQRSLVAGQDVNTCYMDGQVNMALFILVAGFFYFGGFWRQRRLLNVFSILGIMLFCLASWMSLDDLPYHFLPRQFLIVQFGWRLVTYQNLSLLLIFVGLLFKRHDLGINLKDNAKTVILAVALTLSIYGAVDRATHSMAARNPTVNPLYSFQAKPDTSFITLPENYLYQHYLTNGLPLIEVSDLDSRAKLTFDIGMGDHFGETLAKKMDIQTPTWLLTNVAVFDWNKIYEDGVEVGQDRIKRHGDFLVVQSKKGLHTMTASFEPPHTLRILRLASHLSLLAVFLCTIGFILFGHIPQRKPIRT